MLHCFKKERTRSEAKGFTIVELLVCLGIVGVLLSVILSNQSKYTEGAALSALADEIGLTLSQAQAYGIAVRELTPGSSDFTASYGLTMSLLGSGSPTSYLFFADRNGNKIYDGTWACPIGGASECREKVSMNRGNYISAICVVRTSGSDQCKIASRVDINFTRPSIEANITLFNPAGQVFDPGNVKGVRIELSSLSGLLRSVTIYETGQISVQ